MGFTFRDIYNVPMSPKRKTYEKQQHVTDLKDVAATNTFYQQLLETEAANKASAQACQERNVANQKTINTELLPSKTLLEKQVQTLQTDITNQQTALTSSNTTMTGLESAGIVSAVGNTVSLTPSAAGLLPITIGATTFTTTIDVQNYIDNTNNQVKTLIQTQNSLTGHYDNYTRLKTSDTPYGGLLAYQKNNYTGNNKTNFAQATGFSTEPQNLVQLDAYSTGNPAPVQGYQGQLNDLNKKIASLQEDCNALNAQKAKQQDELEQNTITSLIKDQEKVLGYKIKVNPLTIALKYKSLKAVQPNTNILEFVDKEFRDNSALAKIDNKINKLGSKVSAFTKAVEGRPNAVQQIKEQQNQYNIFDPALCGLLAMGQDGTILTNNKYHIPFQYVDVANIKVQKTANYNEEHPVGRFEPVNVYGSSTAMQITIPLQYMAFESGYNSDEGFIQEIKDRLFAATFPIYGNYQRAGVRSYGAPNKFVLNMFEKFVNIPVIISEVHIEDQGGNDIYTWLSMGFKISLTLKTSYRVAQVISADEVVDKGVRALAHRSNL